MNIAKATSPVLPVIAVIAVAFVAKDKR